MEGGMGREDKKMGRCGDSGRGKRRTGGRMR